MSDEGERMCPLCTEEMDLTDLQLKPCKCGYEVCVWCWHHIIEMAEKQDTEGRCPACRTPYDKERIVGMAAKCDRMVGETNMERRTKAQKPKSKTSVEARKHLSSVRVIQRNLVYIVGLPLSLADEDLLECREYFGQYGKVLKVSISRPATGTPQASTCNTFSVYITYMKEEEAVRCIQAVHNFVLEGKPLRACFGTTKYCHAWLRNQTCSNPDCFYLHDIGNQEDSFTKDEIISAHTWSRVPQTTSSSLQRRSGSVLPPPADEFYSAGTLAAKVVVKNPSNAKCSYPNGSSVTRSTALPAAASWGLRAAQPTSASMPCLKGSAKQTQDGSTLPLAALSIKQNSAWHNDDAKTRKVPDNGQLGTSKACSGTDHGSRITGSSSDLEYAQQISAWHDDEQSSAVNSNGRSWSLQSSTCTSRGSHSTSSSSSAEIACPEHVTSAWDDDDDNDNTITIPNICNGKQTSSSINGSVKSSKSVLGNVCTGASDSSAKISDANCKSETIVSSSECKESGEIASQEITTVACTKEFDVQPGGILNGDVHSTLPVNRDVQNMRSSLSSSSGVCAQNSSSNHGLEKSPASKDISTKNLVIGFASLSQERTPMLLGDTQISIESSDWTPDPWKQQSLSTITETEDALEVAKLAGSDIMHKNVETAYETSYVSNSSDGANAPHPSRSSHCNINQSAEVKDKRNTKISLPLSNENTILPNGLYENKFGNSLDLESTYQNPCKTSSEEGKCLGRFTDVSNASQIAKVNTGDNNIISNIASMDFDPWDDSSSSANEFFKLLRKTDEENALKSSFPWKGQNSKQSRFSFARREHQTSFIESLPSDNGKTQIGWPAQDAIDVGFDQRLKARNADDFASLFSSGSSIISSDKVSALSRAKSSALPGFSVPNRAPPPGFSSQNRLDEAYNTSSSVQFLGSPGIYSQHQVQISGSSDDVELIDPAILAVGKGRMPFGVDADIGPTSFSTHIDAFESDQRYQLLMQQQLSGHHNHLLSSHAERRFLSPNGSYPSQFNQQHHSSLSSSTHIPLPSSANSHISSGQWNGWNDLQTRSDLNMLEILRNERFGHNMYLPGNEENKYYIPSSSNLNSYAYGV